MSLPVFTAQMRIKQVPQDIPSPTAWRTRRGVVSRRVAMNKGTPDETMRRISAMNSHVTRKTVIAVRKFSPGVEAKVLSTEVGDCEQPAPKD